MSSESISPIPWDLFSPSIRRLAVAFRVRPELLLTYLTSAIGGVSGSQSRLAGGNGEFYSPALPMILAVRHPGVALKLQTLAIEPAQRFDDSRRHSAHAIIPEKYEEFTCTPLSPRQNSHLEIANSTDPLSARQIRTLELLKTVYEPALLITAPEPSSFSAVAAGVFDNSPLVFDPGGRVIRKAIQAGPKQKAWAELLETLGAGARGGADLIRERSDSYHRLQRLHSPFLLHLPAELMGAALHHPSSADLMECAVTVPTERISSENLPPRETHTNLEGALSDLNGLIQDVLWARLSSSGVSSKPKQLPPEWDEHLEYIESRIDALPSHIRRFCGGLYGLPQRFLWTVLAMEEPEDPGLTKQHSPEASPYLEGAIATAHWCVDQQIALIKTGLEEERLRQLQQSALVMVQKLKSMTTPAKFSDLARRYHIQSRELHLPILELLEQEGVLSWDSDARLIRLRPDRANAWVAGLDQGSPGISSLDR